MPVGSQSSDENVVRLLTDFGPISPMRRTLKSNFVIPWRYDFGSIDTCFSSSKCGRETEIIGVKALAPAAKASSSAPGGRRPPLSSALSRVLDGECMASPRLLAEFGVEGVWHLDEAAAGV